MNIGAWLIATGLALWSVFGAYPYFQLDSPYHRWESSLYLAFFRLAWSIGVVWFIVACSTDHGGKLLNAIHRHVHCGVLILYFCPFNVFKMNYPERHRNRTSGGESILLVLIGCSEGNTHSLILQDCFLILKLDVCYSMLVMDSSVAL